MPQTIRFVNNVEGVDVDLNCTVEVDEGVAFIAFADDDENTVDLCLTDPDEVDEFFRQMDLLKKEWERIHWDNRRINPNA